MRAMVEDNRLEGEKGESREELQVGAPAPAAGLPPEILDVPHFPKMHFYPFFRHFFPF